jgi:hypothetical protein
MSSKFVLAALRYVGIATAFATCGAWSAAEFLPSEFPIEYPHISLVLPIPFAILCTLLFLRTLRAILIIPSIIVAWLASEVAAAQIFGYSRPFLSACVGGMIGGLALTLSVSVDQRKLLSPKYLIAGCAIGGISAVPLGFWLHLGQIPLGLWESFGIWQGVVGTYLYAIWTREAR